MATNIAESLDADEPYYTALSTADTVRARHLAALMDNVLAMVVAVFAAKSIDDSRPILQAVALAFVFFAYYLVFELLFARTLGKFVTGLVVVDLEGRRCSWLQVVLRTVYRVFEVNPLFLGGLPAAARIIFSEHHQRFGDRAAETLVVYSRVLKQSRG